MAARDQFTAMLSTTRLSAMTVRLLPLKRRVAFHPASGQTEIHTAQSWTPSHQFWCYQITSTPWRWGQS